MLVPAIEKLGARTVVGRKHHNRIFQSAHRLELIQHAANLAIHPVNHGRVNRHLGGLKSLLFLAQSIPRDRARHFISADLLVQFLFGEVPVGYFTRLAVAQGAIHQAHLQLALVALLANHIPAHEISVAIPCDVLGRRLQWKMRHSEGEIGEKGLAGKLRGVILEASGHEIREGYRGVVIAVLGHRRQTDVIKPDTPRIKIAVVVLQPVRAVKPAVGERIRRAVHMPLAAVVGAVAQRLEVRRQQTRPTG